MMVTRLLASCAIFVFALVTGCGDSGTGTAPSGFTTETATLTNITQINEDGFGDPSNRYAFSSAQYKGDLYIGTLNADTPADVYKFIYEIPPNSQGAQVWRGNTQDGTWVWTQVLADGLDDPTNFGVRKMLVCGDYLYAVTANYTKGFELWRFDGDTWEVEIQGGMGDTENVSGRGLLVFDGSLYVGVQNYQSDAKIYRRSVDEDDCSWAAGSEWELITSDGFGENNLWFSDFVEFGNQVYAGTLNLWGMQVWRSESGDAGTWEKVLDDRLLLSANTAAMKLYVFDDHLLVGTQNRPLGGQLLKSADGVSFSAVADHGVDGNRENIYAWYMLEFADRLYVSFLNTPEGFNLFSLPDLSGDFVTETTDALGVPAYFGVRTMEVFDGQFIMGCVTAEMSARVYSAEE